MIASARVEISERTAAMPALNHAPKALRWTTFRAAAVALGLALLAARAEAYAVGTRTKGGGEIITNEKVIALSKAEIAEDMIIEKIQGSSRTQFDLTSEGMIRLKEAGVGAETIRVMWRIYQEEKKKHDRVIRNMIQLLRSDDAEHYARAVRVLVRYGAYAVPLLIDNLAEEDERIRAGVCEILGRIGDPPALESLLDALLDRNKAVRARAAKAVSMFDRETVLARIGKAISHRGSVRDGYALALGYLGDLKHQKTLIEITDAPGPESDRAAAAYALGLLGDASPEAVDVLIEAALSDTHRELREAATRALGGLAERMEPRIRTEVSFALSKAIDRYRPSRAVIVEQMRFFPGRRTVETLLARLEDRDRDVSAAAWESLKAVTGEVWPRDAAAEWRSWWEIAQLQPRWQEERLAPGFTGEEVVPEEAFPGPEEEGAAAPEAGIQEPGDRPRRAADAAPELGIRTTPPLAPEDPFAR